MVENIKDYFGGEACYVCGNSEVVRHEIFYGKNRQTSIKNNFIVWLCPYHHNTSNFGVHFNRELDLDIKRKAQRKYEIENSREDFIKLIGKSYLE